MLACFSFLPSHSPLFCAWSRFSSVFQHTMLTQAYLGWLSTWNWHCVSLGGFTNFLMVSIQWFWYKYGFSMHSGLQRQLSLEEVASEDVFSSLYCVLKSEIWLYFAVICMTRSFSASCSLWIVVKIYQYWYSSRHDWTVAGEDCVDRTPLHGFRKWVALSVIWNFSSSVRQRRKVCMCCSILSDMCVLCNFGLI